MWRDGLMAYGAYDFLGHELVGDRDTSSNSRLWLVGTETLGQGPHSPWTGSSQPSSQEMDGVSHSDDE